MSCSPPSPSPALDLLDDKWFFSNTLASRSPSTSTGQSGDDGRRRMSSSKGSAGSRRLLLRTPSLPSSPRRRVEEEEQDDDHSSRGAAAKNQQQQQLVVDADDEDLVDDDDLNWSSIYEGVLRSRMAAKGGGGGGGGGHSSSRSAALLQRAPSMPVVPSDRHGGRQSTRPGIGMPRLRHSCNSMLMERHAAAAAPAPAEREEEEELMRESPISKQPQRPALVRRVHSSLSTAEMKDQLRMWAQAVACNARHEC